MKYKSEDEAIYDALNLARSMTYKTAAAGLSCGGGKTVIMDVEGMDRVLALKTVARFIESLDGIRFNGNLPLAGHLPRLGHRPGGAGL